MSKPQNRAASQGAAPSSADQENKQTLAKFLQSKPEQSKRASSHQSSSQSQNAFDEPNSYLGRLIEKIQQLISELNKPGLSDLKKAQELKQHATSVIHTLRDSSNMSQNGSFISNLQDISETIDQMKEQLDRYRKANVIRRTFILSDVNAKLTSLDHKLSSMRLLIETFKNINQTQSQLFQSHAQLESHSESREINQSALIRGGNVNTVSKAVGEALQKRIQELHLKLSEMQSQITLQGSLADQNQLQAEAQQKKQKSKLKKQYKAADNEAGADPLQQKNQENIQQRLKGEQLCLEADKLFFGIGQKQDKNAAIALYQEAVDYECTKAMLTLAQLYEDTDKQKAFQLYDNAAIQEPYALFKLGEFIEEYQDEDKKIASNKKIALGYYLKAISIDKGSREAQFKLAQFFHKGIHYDKNIKKAINLYEEAAAGGHFLAMNALGSLFYNDMKDYVQAAEWFKKASEYGCARSMNNLGICYEFGQGVEKDKDQAYQLYKEAAEKGHIQAMINLAYLTMNNASFSNISSQYKESAFWFRKLTIVDPQLSDSYFNLGRIHELGLGIDRDLKGAYQYYKKAARLNDAEALSKCGDFLYSGKVTGGISDRQEALRCYRKAAEMNSASGMNSLGLLLESENMEEAQQLYKQAHLLGNTDATVNLAIAYIKIDKTASRALLSLAVKKGHARALDYMVDFGFLESNQINPQVVTSEDQQILQAIGALPQQTPQRPNTNNTYLGGQGVSNKNGGESRERGQSRQDFEIAKPTHQISGSSGNAPSQKLAN